MILSNVDMDTYAFRVDSVHHALCRTWMTGQLERDAAFGFSPLAAAALVRITTNARTQVSPSPLSEAFGFCNYVMVQPNCRIIEPGERHWAIFERLTRDTETTGPRVTDTWFAALAIEHGCEWVTLDRDYARYPGLKWSVPG